MADKPTHRRRIFPPPYLTLMLQVLSSGGCTYSLTYLLGLIDCVSILSFFGRGICDGDGLFWPRCPLAFPALAGSYDDDNMAFCMMRAFSFSCFCPVEYLCVYMPRALAILKKKVRWAVFVVSAALPTIVIYRS
ncbi:hypothetical protein B0I35DRAFT_271107 [Stachybotrys elegans]|uniref:Uncharacterized protein n=1 Tax=Stachybotrys elegans TaxID=80388 RepID=A0A8K0WP25_9HYPO|nr:hypothetical protein B0I35DRAFT_271107 [Stachybotrys elegans]